MVHRLLIIPFVLLTLLLVHQPASAKDKSYTMVCQGGRGMTATFERKIRFDKPNLFITTIKFAKALQSAGQQAPELGQCSWLDRPISATEPSVLVFQRKNKNPIWQMNISKGNFMLKSAEAEEFALLNAVHKGEQVILSAKRDGDVFRITKVGP